MSLARMSSQGFKHRDAQHLTGLRKARSYLSGIRSVMPEDDKALTRRPSARRKRIRGEGSRRRATSRQLRCGPSPLRR
jgi:hypothetical protein